MFLVLTMVNGEEKTALDNTNRFSHGALRQYHIFPQNPLW
jgi:hypothetical protein